MSSQALDFINFLVIFCHERTKLLTAVYLHKINEKLQLKSFHSIKNATTIKNMKNRRFNIIVLIKFY